MRDKPTHLSDATRQAEGKDAHAAHVADPAAPHEDDPIEVEEGEVDPDVRDHYQEMAELGADNVGEGRIP